MRMLHVESILGTLLLTACLGTSKVVVLSTANFDETIANDGQDPILIDIYAPW